MCLLLCMYMLSSQVSPPHTAAMYDWMEVTCPVASGIFCRVINSQCYRYTIFTDGDMPRADRQNIRGVKSLCILHTKRNLQHGMPEFLFVVLVAACFPLLILVLILVVLLFLFFLFFVLLWCVFSSCSACSWFAFLFFLLVFFLFLCVLFMLLLLLSLLLFILLCFMFILFCWFILLFSDYCYFLLFFLFCY